MNSTPLSRLQQLLPQPESAETPRIEWDSVETELGTTLPHDYRALMNLYGGGCVDNYLWLLEPHCSNENYDLLTLSREAWEDLNLLWEEGEERPPELTYPDARLIAWATTDNGDNFYWLVHPDTSPDKWPTLINEPRGSTWERHDVSCTELLTTLLDGSRSSTIIDRDYWLSGTHSFQRSDTFL